MLYKFNYLDIDALRKKVLDYKGTSISWTGRWLRTRLVMSTSTREELRRECDACGQLASYGGGGGTVTFYGCEVDLNDSLAFGEILFTVDVEQYR